LSERQRTQRPAVATFRDVTPQKRRLPSWLAQRYQGSSRQEPRIGPNPRVPADIAASAAKEAAAGPPRPMFGPLAPRTSKPTARPASHAPTERGEEPVGITPAELAELLAERSALEEARRSTDTLASAMSRAIAELELARERALDELHQPLVELAALIARRIISRELTLDPSVVVELVREGLQALADRRPLRVRLGGGFASALERVHDMLAEHGTGIEVVLDQDLDTWGCLVQTDIARVDESIEARLDLLLSSLDRESLP
jgi:hypothetical protein